MYTLERDTEIALMEVALMHPNHTIDELLLIWVNRFYREQGDEFQRQYSNSV
jgi:hypothetical protein